MYQHTKRDVHIFSEPRNQFTVNQRGSRKKAPPNCHHSPERGKSRIGVDPQQLEAVIPLPEILGAHFGSPLASADVTSKPSDEAQTHCEIPSAPLFPKNSNLSRLDVTNAYDRPVRNRLQNSRRVFEEFERHLPCAALLFNWLAAIFRLWHLAAWYIFSCASQTFLVKILVSQLSAVWSALVPVVRHSALVWVLSIVNFALEANEVFVELARCTNNSNGPVFDGSKTAHMDVPVKKTVETADVSTSAANPVL